MEGNGTERKERAVNGREWNRKEGKGSEWKVREWKGREVDGREGSQPLLFGKTKHLFLCRQMSNYLIIYVYFHINMQSNVKLYEK